MENLTELLFALSNIDRMKLLLELQSGNHRLTQLAKKISATLPETSKHLARLTDAKMIEKDQAGSYRLTAYGRTTLELLPSFNFVSENREYFLKHDVHFLPPGFVDRIGELSEHERLEHMGAILNSCLQLVREGEQYVYFMTDQLLPEVFRQSHVAKASFRAILPSSIAAEAYQSVGSILRADVEFRFMDDVKVAIALNEKAADICFPDLDGRVDFSRGFKGENTGFHRWCHDLFIHYWERSKKLWPGQLQGTATSSSVS